MCISQDSGGHHGRLAIAMPQDIWREVVAPETTQSMDTSSHDRKRPHRRISNHQHFKHNYQVQHHYVDHSADPCTSETLPQVVDMEHMDRLHFPVKLHAILDHIEEDGLANVVSWQPHGRAFRIHNHDVFLKSVMPRYFHQSKLASFQRQLNLYGFQRITRGTDKGSYYHPRMLRGKEFLAHDISRTRVKGTGVRPRSNPEQEPNFYAMPPIDHASPASIEMKKEARSTTTTSRSPSPAVMDHRSPKEKLEQTAGPVCSSSNIVPYETPSSSSSSEEVPSSAAAGDMDIDDQVIVFEGQKFHYLDPYDDTVQERTPKPVPTLVPSMCCEHNEHEEDDDAIFTGEQMDAMMASLKEPGGIWSINLEDMDDVAFGNVLENLVIHGSFR